MLIIEETNVFRRDLKKSKKRGKDFSKLNHVVQCLAAQIALEARHRPHPLRGVWVPSWECHIEPDWLLVYEVQGDRLLLIRTGTHSDIFG